jgi:hypothetical protein
MLHLPFESFSQRSRKLGRALGSAPAGDGAALPFLQAVTGLRAMITLRKTSLRYQDLPQSLSRHLHKLGVSGGTTGRTGGRGWPRQSGVGVRWAVARLTCRCARKVSQRYTVQEKSNTAPKIRFSAGISHRASSDAHIPMAIQFHRLLQRATVPHRHLSPHRLFAVSQHYGSLPSASSQTPAFIPPSPRSQQCHKNTLPLAYCRGAS